MIKFPKKPFNLFIDVGLSYNAPHSVEALQKYDNVFVIGIEPNPDNCASVRAMALGDRFHLVEAGIGNVGEEKKSMPFYMMHPDPGTSSFLKPTGVLPSRGYKITGIIDVPLITLSSILDLVPWDLVLGGEFDLKTDTQGFEVQVLLSLGKYITKVKNLQVESTTNGCYEMACNFGEILYVLNGHMTLINEYDGNAWFIKK